MSDTKTYKVLRPIGFNGDRLEKDATVELTDEEAQNIGPDVELVGAQTEQIDESAEKSGDESTGEGESDSSEDEKTEETAEGQSKDSSADEKKADEEV